MQPGGAWAVLHAAEFAGDEQRAGGCPALGEVEDHVDVTFERCGHRAGFPGIERAETAGCELARDACYAEAVAAVRGDVDVDDRAFDGEHVGGGLADLGVGGELDDAVMVLADAKFARGAEHALALDAADLGAFQRLAAFRDDGADGGEHALQAEMHVGSAADDFKRALAGVDLAEVEALGVGVAAKADDFGDGEGGKIGAQPFDAVDLEAERGQLLVDLLDRGVGVEVFLQPG